MNPKVWGPDVWKTMHIIATAYPNKPRNIDKKNYKRFYMSLGCTLPCKFCAKSYRKFMKELDIDNFLDGKRNLMYWVYLMHNKVNKKLKKRKKLQFKKVCKKYMLLLKK